MSNATLYFRNGDRKGQSVSVHADKFLIGRHQECNLQLESRTISRRHCAIVRVDDQVLLVDLGGRNPTVLNGNPLVEGKPVLLKHRDKLQVGRVKMRFLSPSEVVSESESPAGDALAAGDLPPQGADGGTPWQQVTKKSASAAPHDLEDESSATSVLSELEELVSSFDDQGWTTLNRPAKPGSPGQGEIVDFETAEYKNPPGDEENGDDEEPAVAVAEPAEPNEPSQPHHSANSNNQEVGEGEAADQDEEKVPGKIPQHLRPQGPVSSQSAAEIALKNLFGPR